jgi:hypothetical protein
MHSLLHTYMTGLETTLSTLLSRLRELETKEYPTRVSKQLLTVLGEGINAYKNILVEATDQLEDAPMEYIETYFDAGRRFLEFLHVILHKIASSGSNEVPKWMIEPLKSELKKHIGSNLDIIMVAGSVGHNFFYESNLDKDLRELFGLVFKDPESLLKSLPKNISIFHFPSGEKDNVIAHIAFFHEIAHEIDQLKLKISEEIFSESIKSEKEKSPRKEEPKKGKHDLHASHKEIIASWSREFTADLIATRILGPAYAIALLLTPGILGRMRIHAVTHPAMLLRLKFVFELLNSFGFRDSLDHLAATQGFEKFSKLYEHWNKEVSEAQYESMPWKNGKEGGFKSEKMVQIGHKIGEEVLKKVVNLGEIETCYISKDLIRDMENQYDLLSQFIPINESINITNRTRHPNSIVTIYNVGVLYYLNTNSSEKKIKVQKILRKSIELSQIHQKAIKYSDKILVEK